MTRESTSTVSLDADDSARKDRTAGKVGGKNTEIGKVSRSDGSSRPSTGGPYISSVEGLTPVESSGLSHNARQTMKVRGRNSTSHNGMNTEEVSPLNANSRVVAPMAEMDDSDMCEVDLGDGANGSAGGKAGNGEGDKQNGDTTDKGGDRLKPTHSGKDETDALSIYSLYMENDFRYYFQHPYLRVIVAYFVIFCNFFIYAEDPVAHSRTECNIPVIGNSFAFVVMRYPPNGWSVLKVFLWLVGIVVGLLVGKIIMHSLLFNRLFRLKMFTEDKGSWMVMFLMTIFSLFIFSLIYTGFLMIGGDSTQAYRISPYMNIANNIFMKVAATGTWCGDVFTAWMVTDMMLQEKLYPMWAKKPRIWWNRGYNRIILFWIAVLTSSFIVIFVIATDYISWDTLNRDFLHSNELSRAFLASFILLLDIIIVMQDWDFPHFIGAIDIKLPGVNTAHIKFKIPRLLKRLEYWHVHISGKWFNYGILFIVILLDLNMWKNQIFYKPIDYGQYVDSEGRIHSVSDAYTLNNINNETLISFAYRNSTVDPLTNLRYIELDTVMNARYNEYSYALKALAFVPCVGIFVTFGVLVWIYGRLPKPTKEDPYAGRLKKRKKRRFSWRRLRKRFRTTSVKLTGFRSSSAVEGAGEGISMEAKVVEVWKNTKKEDLVDGPVQQPAGTKRVEADGDTITVETETGTLRDNGADGDQAVVQV